MVQFLRDTVHINTKFHKNLTKIKAQSSQIHTGGGTNYVHVLLYFLQIFSLPEFFAFLQPISKYFHI